MKRTACQKGKIICSIIILCFIITGMSSSANGPKIKFKETSFDFGVVKQGKAVNHIFMFVNTGDETLRIDKVDSACGCTAALVSAKKIAPGATGEIKVTLNTTGYQGKLSKYVYVESNDKSQPRKQLTVSANIEVPPQPRIQLDKYTSDEGLFVEGEPIKATTTIRNQGELELRIDCSHKDAKFSSRGKEISFPYVIPSGKSIDLEVTIPPRNRVGLLREYILIKSNDPSRQTISFYVSGYSITKKQLKDLFAKYRDILD